jgi:MFS family permease
LLVTASPNIILFTAGLALLGALGSVYHPLANSLITSKVKDYGIALGIHGSAGNIGLAITPVIAALIGSQFGWRNAYLFFAFPGIVLSAWSLFIDMGVKEKRKEEPSPSPAIPTSSRENGMGAFFTPPLVLIYLLNMLHSFSYHGATIFLPTYMAKSISIQIFSWDSVAIGGIFSGIALCTGAFGQYMGGALGQRPHLERNVLILCVMGLPFILAMAFARDWFLLAVALVYFFFNFALQPATNVLLAQNTAVRMRGTAFGIFFFAAFGLGSLASSFSGFIAQKFGLPWVFVGLSFTTLILIACAFVLLKMKKGAEGGFKKVISKS